MTYRIRLSLAARGQGEAHRARNALLPAQGLYYRGTVEGLDVERATVGLAPDPNSTRSRLVEGRGDELWT